MKNHNINDDLNKWIDSDTEQDREWDRIWKIWKKFWNKRPSGLRFQSKRFFFRKSNSHHIIQHYIKQRYYRLEKLKVKMPC